MSLIERQDTATLCGPDGLECPGYKKVEIIPPGTKPEDAILILKYRQNQKSNLPDIKD